MSASPHGIPPGFHPVATGGDFIGINGPLYLKHERGTHIADGGVLVQMGFRVEHRHCNPMAICHGGWLASFADMLMPLSIHRKAPDVGQRFLPTISLQIDYLAPARLGAWVQGEAQVLRTTRSLVFAQGLVSADGVPSLRCSGVFKIGPPFQMPGPAVTGGDPPDR
jgi:uncharacterized protein (TIGR00369 family)